jgi:hypothetical protein
VGWKNDIADALNELGGEASTAELYALLSKKIGVRRHRKWKPLVLKTLHLHDPDSRQYGGGEPLFYRNDSSRWGVRIGRTKAAPPDVC